MFIGRSFSLTDQRQRTTRLGSWCEVADEAWDYVRDGETAYRGSRGRQSIAVGLLPVDNRDAVDSVGGWLEVNGAREMVS